MNSVWIKLLPKYVNFRGFEGEVKDIQKTIVQLATEAEFNEVDTDDDQDFPLSHCEELTNKELIQLDAEKLSEKEEELDEPQKTLDTKTLKILQCTGGGYTDS
jgi:hypothetical protein